MFWIEALPDGRIAASGMGGTVPEAAHGGQVHTVDALHHPNECLFVDGQVMNLGPAPSAAHRIDPALRRWVCDEAAAWAHVRAKRDRLLASTDWVILRAQEQAAVVPTEWLAYRQALRDITEQTDPSAVAWPGAPSN